ncbi:N-acetyltransferase [Pseudoduganella sp. GCM10020061]|uniref:N-acetyltransferase n=1 Tax=Pseudoduganella sp. GCM10020061 TaxID=3317345 RepID=UPI003645C81C
MLSRRVARLFAPRPEPKALRIDVHQHPGALQQDLDETYRRMSRNGDLLHGLPALDIDFPGLVFRYRQADGEHYVYAEDTARRCLAGYTVFNRLIEINRRADRHLRAPHSKYAPYYQRRGIASAVYRWWLDAGHCLISGARQSAGAHALWRALGRRYPLVHVEVRDKCLHHLGADVDECVREALATRMVLAGEGWDGARLATILEGAPRG